MFGRVTLVVTERSLAIRNLATISNEEINLMVIEQRVARSHYQYCYQSLLKGWRKTNNHYEAQNSCMKAVVLF
jgi:hypothetical protein